MLSRSQILRVVALGVGMWLAATLYVRLLPPAFVDIGLGAAGYAAILPLGWLSVWLARRIGGLSAVQLLSGVGVVGAAAMMIDGLVLRWAPTVYGADEHVVRLGAAWLLWGYGVSLAVALVMAERMRRA